MRRIRVDARCRGLPYAAVLSGHVAVTQTLRLMASLALRLGVAASIWLDQDNYHVAKENRGRHDYEGFRVLALISAEGRVLQELWAQRYMGVIRAALPDEQESGGDCLAAGLLDLECHAVCAGQGRPYVELFTDEAEAFDSQDRRSAMVAVNERAGVRGKAWLLLDSMMDGTTVVVVAHGHCSRRIRPHVGMPGAGS